MSRLVITPVNGAVSAVTLTSSGAARVRLKEGPQRVRGYQDDISPVVFEFERFTRSRLTDLKPIAIPQSQLIGPHRNAAGTAEALTLGTGEISQIQWDERDRQDPTAAVTTYSDYGVIVITEATLTGFRERMVISFFPCDTLYDANGNSRSAP